MKLDALDHLEYLSDAISEAELGFYFEEGGCFGMALAIHEHLSRMGLPAHVALSSTDFVHAYAELNGNLYDHHGRVCSGNYPNDLEILTPNQLIHRAETEYGHPNVLDDKNHPNVLDDKYLATKILNIAYKNFVDRDSNV
jgi:hypothetical protein